MSSLSALALLDSDLMQVDSDLLGLLEFAEEDVIHFADGLFGFPDQHSFLLISAAREGFFWLQSTEHGSLVFLVADPFVLFDGYAVDLSTTELAALGGNERSEIAVLAIVTLPSGAGETPTANLQGPLAINVKSGRGRQLAIQHSEFGVRCPFEIAASG